MPMIALSKQLQQAGHDVMACSYDSYQSLFQQHSISFTVCGPPFDAKKYAHEVIRLQEKSFTSMMPYVMEQTSYLSRKYFQDCLATTKNCDFAIIHRTDHLGREPEYGPR